MFRVLGLGWRRSWSLVWVEVLDCSFGFRVRVLDFGFWILGFAFCVLRFAFGFKLSLGWI